MRAPNQAMRVKDPVCDMTLDLAQAVASETRSGETYYFCSETCHRRFLASPEAFAPGETGAGRAAPGRAAVIGTAASLVLLAFYFGLLTLLSGSGFALDQFRAYWPFIVTLAAGFGVQFGLFIYLRSAHGTRSGKVVAVTGTTSGAAMVSCCTHYLANLLPVLGATGLVSLVGAYQVELFWFGLLANLAGIAYSASRLRPLLKERRT